jgi:hypothetical protein
VLIMIENIDLISTVGFPIAVTCYLLYERNAATKELRKTVADLTTVVSELTVLIRERLN